MFTTLSPTQLTMIRTLIDGGKTNAMIGRETGIKVYTISNIRNNKHGYQSNTPTTPLSRVNKALDDDVVIMLTGLCKTLAERIDVLEEGNKRLTLQGEQQRRTLAKIEQELKRLSAE